MNGVNATTTKTTASRAAKTVAGRRSPRVIFSFVRAHLPPKVPISNLLAYLTLGIKFSLYIEIDIENPFFSRGWQIAGRAAVKALLFPRRCRQVTTSHGTGDTPSEGRASGLQRMPTTYVVQAVPVDSCTRDRSKACDAFPGLMPCSKFTNVALSRRPPEKAHGQVQTSVQGRGAGKHSRPRGSGSVRPLPHRRLRRTATS